MATLYSKELYYIYGTNPFINNLTSSELKQSLIDRLWDYMYDVRKLSFDNTINRSKVISRWAKFSRIGIFLVCKSSDFTFPEVLYILQNKADELIQNCFNCSPDEGLVAKYETVWNCILNYNSNFEYGKNSLQSKAKRQY